VGDGIGAVYAADREAERQKGPVAEHIGPQQQENDKVEPGGDEVERVYGALSRIGVEVWPGDEGHDHLRQVVDYHVERIEEHAAGVVEHEQAYGKAADGVSQHGDDGAEGYDGEVAGPEAG